MEKCKHCLQPDGKHLVGCPQYVKPENRQKPFDYEKKDSFYSMFKDTIFGDLTK